MKREQLSTSHQQPIVLIDSSWWWGGNRTRGVGRYIQHFLTEHYSSDDWQRVWLVPNHVSQKQLEQFSSAFPGEVVRFPFGASESEQRGRWGQIMNEHEAKVILIPSPFERPASLLDLGDGLRLERKKSGPRLEAIVFDLIPLEYQREVLASWSPDDQQHYRERLAQLATCDHIYALSPDTATLLEQRLQFPARHISVPEFVWESEWLQVPATVKLPSPSGVPVVTISGGEWRKNLAGTITWFARAYSGKHHLYVICRLGYRERLGFWWQALRCGVPHRVHFLGSVSEAEKWGWLFTAEGLLFLSRAEGLGMPLLEAARAGTPRIVISRELAQTSICEHLPAYTEVALE